MKKYELRNMIYEELLNEKLSAEEWELKTLKSQMKHLSNEFKKMLVEMDRYEQIPIREKEKKKFSVKFKAVRTAMNGLKDLADTISTSSELKNVK
jgi:hypothetical protein